MDSAFTAIKSANRNAELAKQAKAGRDAIKFASDPNFYSVLVFDTAEQRDVALDMLKEIGAVAGMEITGARYLNGLAVMTALLKVLGFDSSLPASPEKLTSPFKVASSLEDLAMTAEEHNAIPLPNEFAPVQFHVATPLETAPEKDVLDDFLNGQDYEFDP